MGYSFKFSWKVLREIGEEFYKGDIGEIMKPLQISLDTAKAEGREEGRMETLKNFVLRMLKDGSSYKNIQKYTGLSEKDINSLKKEKPS